MPPQSLQNSSPYNANQIKYLEPRQHVRLRPGMYIGGTHKGALHEMLWEVLKDTISEFEGGLYNTITITLLPNKTICVADDGKGIPVNNYDLSQTSCVETYLTQVGRRPMKRQGYDSASTSNIGLFGVGLPAINALSTFCIAEVKRDGFLWRQSYSEGLATSPLEQIRRLKTTEFTGTKLTFKPDFSIMDENEFDFELITKRCRELAYLLPQLRFTILDRRKTEREMSFYYPKGIIQWVKTEAGREKPVSEALSIYYDCELIHSSRNQPYIVTIELALQWIDSDMHQLQGFVNRDESPKGGTHLSGLMAALCKHLEIRSWPKIRRGFIGIIHVLHPDPYFKSQTHVRLLNSDALTAVDEAIEALFAAHPEAKEAIQAHFGAK